MTLFYDYKIWIPVVVTDDAQDSYKLLLLLFCNKGFVLEENCLKFLEQQSCINGQEITTLHKYDENPFKLKHPKILK